MTGSVRARLAAVRRRPALARIGACILLAAGIAACSTDDVLRPTVDIGQQTSAIQPVREAPARLAADDNLSVDMASPQDDPTQDVVADEGQAQLMSVPQADLEEQASLAPVGDPETVVEPETSGEFGGTRPLSVEMEDAAEEPVRQTRVAALPRPNIAPLPPSEPYQSSYPRLDRMTPKQPRSMSSDEADCRRQLKKLGVKYQDLGAIRDAQACYIDNPVKVTRIGSVEMKPAATLTCQMALTFARWTKNELVPNARWRYFSGIKTIRQGSSYSCRKIAGSRTPSAHSQGNALDVMALVLNNGKEIDVTKKGFFSFRERKLLNNVRADGCEYFTTVLGPGYNYDHRNHFHFDLMQRKSGKRACR